MSLKREWVTKIRFNLMCKMATVQEATSTSKTQSSVLQKKILNYARDVALDKLHKKLDKRIAKQQIRKKEQENVYYERCSQGSDFMRPNSTEFTASSISSMQHASNPCATNRSSTIGTQNVVDGGNLINQNFGGVGQSVDSVATQDDDFETADEAEDDELLAGTDEMQTVKVCEQSTCNSVRKLLN